MSESGPYRVPVHGPTVDLCPGLATHLGHGHEFNYGSWDFASRHVDEGAGIRDEAFLLHLISKAAAPLDTCIEVVSNKSQVVLPPPDVCKKSL